MHLYCMRHGEAYSFDSNPEQPLTPQGHQDVVAVANFLVRKSIHIDHIVHSDKLRAKQTATLMGQITPVPQVTETAHLLTENTSFNALIDFIDNCNEDTLIIGHLPLLDNLVQHLVTGQLSQHAIINYQPATLVRLISCHRNHWLLDWLVHPDLLSSFC